MKKIFELLAIFFFPAATLIAQPIEQLYDVIPGFSQASAKILPNTRGGYVIAGNVETSYTPGANNEMYLTGIKGNGDLEWTKSYNATGVQLHQFSRAITQLTSSSQVGGSGYFMVCGGKSSSTPKAFAVRTNSLGNALASATSTLPYEVTFNNVCNASNGGFIAVGVTGESNIFNLVCGDAVVAKFNAQGNLVWIKKLVLPTPFTCTYGAWSVIQAPGGGYIIAGDLIVWKTDANGNQQWVKYLNNIGSLSRYDDIQRLPSGEGYLMTGWQAGNSSGNGVYAAKIDNNGNLLASNVFATDAADMLAHTPVFLSSSVALLTATFTIDLYIRGYKFNLNDLQIIESGYLSNSVPAWTCSLLKTNNKFIIGGEGLDVNNNYNGNFYSFITDEIALTNFAPVSDRNISFEQLPRRTRPEALQAAVEARQRLLESTSAVGDDFVAYPNPGRSQITLSGPVLQAATWFKVLNTEGKLMLEGKIPASTISFPLDVSALPEGVYFVEVIGADCSAVKKIVVE